MTYLHVNLRSRKSRKEYVNGGTKIVMLLIFMLFMLKKVGITD